MKPRNPLQPRSRPALALTTTSQGAGLIASEGARDDEFGRSVSPSKNAGLTSARFLATTFACLLTWAGLLQNTNALQTDGNYVFEITGYDTAEIRGYNGGGTASIPDKVTAVVAVVENGPDDERELTVTSIGESAFANSNITGVTIPITVNTIKRWAFTGCDNLTSANIPNSVGSIGIGVFQNCSSLNSVSLPAGLTSIPDACFERCPSLNTVTIPASVTSINYRAFSACSSLTSITIPGSVTSIGNDAFSRCSSLSSIIIPDSVTSIGIQAFEVCSDLIHVTIGQGVTSIPDGAFEYCYQLEDIIIPGNIISIGNSAFGRCTSLTSITIPGSVLSIGPSAFEDCDELATVTILNGVTDIGYLVFAGCGSLTSVTIPDSVTSLGDYAFEFCAALTRVVIGKGITEIGLEVFYNCTSLTDVIIANSVTSIGDGAFTECDSLTSIDLPSGLTSIGEYAFWRCRSLKSITIPGSVLSIGPSAFEDCYELATVTILNGVTDIGDLVFAGCSRLTRVTIPDSVTSLGDNAFELCTGLTRVVIGKGITDMGMDLFYGCASLTDVIIANSITSIPDGAFAECSSLTSIDLPSGLTSIGEYAFWRCRSLKSIDLPSGVTSIGKEAFDGCTDLASCLFLGSAPSTFGTNVFPSDPDFTIIYLRDSKGFMSPTWNGYRCELRPSQIAIATVRALLGNVSVIRDGKVVTLKLGDPVYLDDVIRTGTQSYTKIGFNNGSALNISPKSRITVEYYDVHDLESPAPAPALYLHEGDVRFHKSSGRKTYIKTKTAALGVRGTTLTVEVTEENGILTTTTEVLEGVIDHENLITGQDIELQTGESVSAQAAPETRSLTLNHASPSLGSLWLNGTEITSFPHVVIFDQGAEINLQAVPNATGAFASWAGDIVSMNPDYTFILDEDMTLTGNFLPWTDFATEHPGLAQDGDANGSGGDNFLDYASGQDPEAPGPAPLVVASPDILTLRQRINGLDANPVAQYSDNLSDWYPLEQGIHFDFSTRTATGEMRTVVIYLSAGQPEKRFFRQTFEP